MKIDPTKTQKESTYQVVLDALALTTCYPAFLITTDVPEIYMHQFWVTINKKDSTSYRFKIDKKRMFMHTTQDDNILGPMRFVSKANDYQVYGALLPEVKTNQKMRVKKVLKRSRREKTIHQVGSSGDGAGFQPEVPNEPKGKSVDIHEGTGLKPGVSDVSKADSLESEYESLGDSGDEDVKY
ncbi:hypothetical protein Tco_1367641 [Tanacetum coccineum]